MPKNRKTARRVLILNWSRFQKLEFRMGGSTFLTGVNTSGKSTVLDAISFLLTGNHQFNKAAKDKDRSVLKYVRGDTESQSETRYLRRGEVVSYIALEFDSPSDGTSIVTVVGTESPDETASQSFWYVARDATLEDFNFYEEAEGRRKVTPVSQLCVKGVRIRAGEWMNQDKGTRQILRALGVRTDLQEYRQKLVHMMAFNPNNNINQFIQECVLEEKKIRTLSTLREHRMHYEEALSAYESLGTQKKLLEETERATVRYEDKSRVHEMKKLLMVYQNWQAAKLAREDNEQACERIEAQLRGLQGQLRTAREEREKAQEAYANAKNQDVLNNVRGTMESLRQEQKDLEAKIRDKEEKLAELLRLQGVWGRELSWLLDESGNDELRSVLERLAQENVSTEKKTAAFATARQLAGYQEESLSTERVHLTDEIDGLRKEIAQLSEEIRALTANQLPLPEAIRSEMDVLKAALARQGIDTQVRTFAELVEELTDESWRSAVETYLDRKRHDLIVEGRYCLPALKIQESQKLKNIQLVLTDKLEAQEGEEGSAASLLKIPNPDARRYADYLLGRLHLCESTDELHEHPQGGLMRNGLLAKGYTTRFLRTEKTRYCLGGKALKMQLEQVEAQRQEKQRDLMELEGKRDGIVTRLKSLKLVNWSADSYDFDSPGALSRFRLRLEETRRQLEIIHNDPNFATAMEILESARKRNEEAQEAFMEVTRRQSVLERDLNERENSAEALAENERNTGIDYAHELEGHRELEETMLSEYAKRRAKHPDQMAIFDKEIRKSQEALDEAMRNMEDKQLAYLRASENDVNRRGPVFIPFFRNQLRELSNVKIEQAKETLLGLRKQLESAFLTDFVAELDENIRKARKEIDGLNQELRLLPFGNDTYRFVVAQKPDRAMFFRICQKLQSYAFLPNLYQYEVPEDEEFEHDMENLMTIILDENQDEEFADYRRYLAYDMEITTRQGTQDVVTSLSRKHGSASGGEKQTPYYIILSAALMQCYPRDVCCERLALVDESFSAMSEDRIEQMVNYFENNGFQVIYSAPPGKLSSIGAAIGTTVSLVQTGRFTQAVEGLIRIEE